MPAKGTHISARTQNDLILSLGSHSPACKTGANVYFLANVQRRKRPLNLSLLSILTKRINWFHDAFQLALEANDGPSLTRAEALVIANMSAGETKASNIARNLGVSRQAVSQILAELSQRDVIIVTENPEDRRSRVAMLKMDPEDEAEICGKIFKALEKELEGRIGPRRMLALYEALEGAWGEPPVLQPPSLVNPPHVSAPSIAAKSGVRKSVGRG